MAKPSPQPTPDTQFYWDMAAKNQLWISRCVATGRCFFPPQGFSPFVVGGDVEWVRASGNATLYSYTITHRALPGFESDVPYAVAVVQLEEGPRMMTNIVGIENSPEHLILDMPLTVDFDDRTDAVVPVFRPAVAA